MPSGAHRLALSTRQSDGSESERSSTLDVIVAATKRSTLASQRSNVVRARAGGQFVIETLATGLDAPSALAVAPDGRVFVAQRSGDVVVWQGDRPISLALSLADTVRTGEVGLIGMTLHPEYSANGRVFIAYTSRDRVGAVVNRIIRFRDVNNVLGEPAVLLEDRVASPPPKTPRIRFGPDRSVYAAFPVDNQADADSSATYAGKILRIAEDGTTPSDSPGLSPIVASGHTLMGGFDWQPGTGQLWLTERDVGGNDLLAMLPLRPSPLGRSTVFSLEPPLDPSGAVFYSKTLAPAFANDLFISSMAGAHVRRIHFDPRDGSRVEMSERLLDGEYGRISDVVAGPDGALYFCTSNTGIMQESPVDDRLVRLLPTNQRP
jgi:glucose/arabinose dehydrogenase